MEAILYIGHGTRSKKGNNEVNSFIHRVIKQVDVPIQEFSFLELTEPCIEVGFRRCVERGATEISVVPLFLFAAAHIKKDLPKVITSIQKRYPNINVNVRNPFGVRNEILDAITELIRNTAGEVTSMDNLLIVGRGSSEPNFHTSLLGISQGIQERLQIENVSVCYLAAAEPRFHEELETVLNRNKGRIIVVPYLLFSGLLLDEINDKILKLQKESRTIIHTGPLSKHQVFEDIVKGYFKC